MAAGSSSFSEFLSSHDPSLLPGAGRCRRAPSPTCRTARPSSPSSSTAAW
nr:hypothetical protein [Angustibacter aerolatus]